MINLNFIFEVPSSDVCLILECVSICILYSCFTFSFYLAWHCVGLEYREGQKMLTYCFPTEFIGMQSWCLSLVSKSKNMYFMPSVKMHNLSIQYYCLRYELYLDSWKFVLSTVFTASAAQLLLIRFTSGGKQS